MATAQDPQITVTAEQDEVIVGQPYILRLKVLVPTFMPKPPIFPTFKVPGLIVRLPARSTTPVSSRIDGTTWAGVQRTYRIYPMRAGVTETPEQKLSIVYKNTESGEDVLLTVTVPAMRITAIVPQAAGSLDPLVLANGLSIEQSWQGGDEELSVGDAVVRKLEISVAGASALFVPPLLDGASPHRLTVAASDDAESTPVAGFTPYPEDARVTESLERGVMSGSRTETVSYIAQSGGATVFPDITLEWFDLKTGGIEEIVLPGRMVLVTEPPRISGSVDRQALLRGVLILVVTAAVAWLVLRWFYPALRPRVHRLQARYDASAIAAHRVAEKKAAAKDLNGVLLALEQRSARGVAPGEALEDAIKAIGRALYRDNASEDVTERHWQTIRQKLRNERGPLFLRHDARNTTRLPPLNPFV
ncbi:BatD family protein [Pseudophaeobacter sp. EL27]|uniref:BatD family protein n=1 Tax=Pseudophaeobacter sp. EL27 TaxID=2107580 RepID=UPI0013C4F113|nr:BatD family protein [Pseudophaeobacter sp. EL27]